MKTSKKAMSALCLLLLAATLFSACSGPAAPTQTSAPSIDQYLLEPGKLKVGMEIGYPPFEMFADDGKTETGLDVDMAKEIAKKLGLQVEFVNTAWDGIFEGLKTDKYDVIMSAITVDSDRMKEMDFSTPYIQNWQCIVVKKGSASIAGPTGLGGLNVGYQNETTSDKYLGDLIKTGEVKGCVTHEYDKIPNCFDDLDLGRLDAVICDSTVADGYVAKASDKFEISWLQKNDEGAVPEEFAVPVKKGNAGLLAEINKALAELEKEGTLEDIREEWLS